MNLKRLSLCAASLVVSLSLTTKNSYAQNTNTLSRTTQTIVIDNTQNDDFINPDSTRYEFRIEVGPTLTSAIPNYGPDSSHPAQWLGRLGISMSGRIMDTNFFFSPGLFLATKGEDQLDGEIDTHTHYMVMPLDLSYRIDINTKGCFFVNLGPYLGYGIDLGKYKPFGNGTYNRFDAGVNASATVEYSHFLVRGGLEIGALDAVKEKKDTNNYQLFMTIGYRFY